ncbi:hypothetical protein [Thermicanus aegyptius]|uniref:hypothetical protein n=1 Tax=Thermicanus aegyptius TaxID=94009 RepID=UPI00041197CD|nr:hypothetical protein [Thermicanus aegyptius]
MGIIAEKDKGTIRDMFSKMTGTSYIRFFFSNSENQEYGEATRQILEELSELTDKLKVEVINGEEEKELVNHYEVDKFPATLFVKEDGTDTGVRFYGIPSGYEFTTLIEDIIDLGNNTIVLAEKTITTLKEITQKVHLQVFVTPT